MKNIINWLNAHPVVRKPLNTFWQTFVAVFVVGAGTVLDAFLTGGIDGGKLALVSLLSAALAAGLSALKTYFVETLKEEK